MTNSSFYVDGGQDAILETAPPGGSGSNLPLMDGIASAGVSHRWSREDHVHPADPHSSSQTPPIFSFEGDSLSNPFNLGTWPTHLKNISAFFARGVSNYYATDGDSAANMFTTYAAQAGSQAVVAGQEAYFFLWACTNDLNGGSSATTCYGHLSSTWAAARASGYKVVAFTLHPIAALDATKQAQRVLLNKAIVSDPSKYDYLVRLDVAFPDTTSAYLSSDGTHLTQAGNLIVAQEVAKTVLGVGSVSSAPYAAMASENLFINGAFTVSQELGSSGAALSPGVITYIADAAKSGYSNAAASIVATRVNSPGLAGHKSFHVLTAVTAMSSLANGDYALGRYPVMGDRAAKLAWGTAAAQPLSYAFWFYSANPGVTFIRVSNAAGDRLIYKEFTVASGYNFVSGTLPGDTAGVWNNTTGVGLWFDVFSSGKDATPQASLETWVAIGSAQTTNSTNLLSTNGSATSLTGLFLTAGPQLANPINLPSLMRSNEEALQLCRRLYYKRTACLMTYGGTGALLGQYLPHPVQMNTTPTVLATGGTPTNSSGLTADHGTTEGMRVFLSVTAGPAAAYNDEFTVVADCRP